MAAAPSTSFVLSPRNSCLISRFSHLKTISMSAYSNTPKPLMLSTTNDKRTVSRKLLPVICSAVKDIDDEKFRDDSCLSRLRVAMIHSWYQRKRYIKSMADLIEKELQTFPTPEETMIFFSANGVPLSYVENAGDPYKSQMENCISLIVEELKSRGTLNDHTLAYQSRVGPAQWLKPYADEVLVELGQRGIKSLLAVPVSFVSECSKTVHGLDVELKELALKSGIVNWGRVPALNCTETFIDVLAKATIKALPRAMPIGSNNPRCHRAVLFCSIGLVTSLALLFCSNELVISLNDHLLPEIIISWISTGSSFLVLRLKSVSKTYLTGLIDGLIKMGLIFLTGKVILALKHFVPADLMRKVKLALKDHLPLED